MLSNYLLEAIVCLKDWEYGKLRVQDQVNSIIGVAANPRIWS